MTYFPVVFFFFHDFPYFSAGLNMTIDKNVAECDKNIEERFELSETESNRHQNEKLQTQDVFEVRIKQQQHG